jgi:hypothetical protein
MDTINKKSIKGGLKVGVFPIMIWFIYFIFDNLEKITILKYIPKSIEFIIGIPLGILFFLTYFLYQLFVLPLALLDNWLFYGSEMGIFFKGWLGGNFFEVPSLTFLGMILTVLFWFIIGFIITYLINTIFTKKLT